MFSLRRLTTSLTPRLPLVPVLPRLTVRYLTTTPTAPSHPTPPTVSTSLGSGRGGKVDKVAAAVKKAAAAERKQDKDGKGKAREVKVKAKAAAAKDKVKLKAKAKAVAAKEKEKATKLKAKAKALAEEKKVATAGRKPRKSTLAPPKAPGSVWMTFIRDHAKERREGLAPGEKLPNGPSLAREAAPLYAALAPSERASLESRTAAANAAYQPVLQAWKESLTIEQVANENKLRSQLRRMKLSRRSNLKVEGAPKQPGTSYMLFSAEKRNDGSLAGISSVTEQAKMVTAEWKSLSPEDKQVYVDRFKSAREQYNVEMEKFKQTKQHEQAESTV